MHPKPIYGDVVFWALLGFQAFKLQSLRAHPWNPCYFCPPLIHSDAFECAITTQVGGMSTQVHKAKLWEHLLPAMQNIFMVTITLLFLQGQPPHRNLVSTCFLSLHFGRPQVSRTLPNYSVTYLGFKIHLGAPSTSLATLALISFANVYNLKSPRKCTFRLVSTPCSRGETKFAIIPHPFVCLCLHVSQIALLLSGLTIFTFASPADVNAF